MSKGLQTLADVMADKLEEGYIVELEWNRLFQSLAFLPSGHGQERDPKRIDPLPQCQLPLREIPEKETENDASRTYAGNPIDSPVL